MNHANAAYEFRPICYLPLPLAHVNKNSQPENGLGVLVMDNNVFRLCGSCLSSPFLFSVNERMHLAYEESVCCWQCGQRSFVVSDVSTGKLGEVSRIPTDID